MNKRIDQNKKNIIDWINHIERIVKHILPVMSAFAPSGNGTGKIKRGELPKTTLAWGSKCSRREATRKEDWSRRAHWHRRRNLAKRRKETPTEKKGVDSL